MVRKDPGLSKLITVLSTATASPNNLEYDKEKTSFADVLDAFLQLSLLNIS